MKTNCSRVRRIIRKQIDAIDSKQAQRRSMDLYESLAHNTRVYRKRLHMSQEELAYRCGLARTQVGLIENGKNITLETLDKLAVGLNVSPVRLLVSFDVDGKPQLDYSERANALDAQVDVTLDNGKNNTNGAKDTDNKNKKVAGNNKNTKVASNSASNTKTDKNDNTCKINNTSDTSRARSPNNSNPKSTKDSSTDLKNCALVYWGGGSLEFQELSEESMDPSIKILSILAQTTSSDSELLERYKMVWPQVMRLLNIPPECEWK